MTDKKYFLGLFVVLLIFVIYEINRPVPIDWESSYHHAHTQPFGSYVLHQLMQEEPVNLQSAFKTNYELITHDRIEAHLLIMANTFTTTKQDTHALLNYVSSGKTVMIHAFNYQGALADSLSLGVSERLRFNLPSEIEKVLVNTPKESILFENEEEALPISELAMTGHFSEYQKSAEVLATNQNKEAVLLRYAFGEGKLLVSTTPLLLTNYFILHANNASIAEKLMNYFPEGETILHNEFYEMGSMEQSTPLRVLLREDALRSATYLAMFTGLLFLLFQSKREQRPIPVIAPLRNTSLEFAQTLGQLYYRQFNHQKLAYKRLLFWKEYVHCHFLVQIGQWKQGQINELTHKSGRPKENIQALFLLFEKVDQQEQISKEELLELEKQLNTFYGKESNG